MTGWVDDLGRCVPGEVVGGEEAAGYAILGRTPGAVARPSSLASLREVMAFAGQRGLAVCPWGGGTSIACGNPPSRLDLVVSLERMNRVLDHQPGDMTVTLQAGVTLDRLQSALAPSGQRLPLDPPHPDRATLGGIAACDAWGPLRYAYGRVRDQLLGATVVTAEGEIVRAGGKVVKNVAGYDLNKLYVGSHGTLGILAELTFKVWPLPERRVEVAAALSSNSQVEPLLAAVLGSELLPAHLEVADLPAAGGSGASPAVTLTIGFEGTLEETEWQVGRLRSLAEPLGAHFAEADEEVRGVLRSWAAWAGGPAAGDASVAQGGDLVCRVSGLSGDVAAHREAAARAAGGVGLPVACFSFAGNGVTLARVEAAPAPEPEKLAAFVSGLREGLAGLRARVVAEYAPDGLRGRVPLWPPEGPPGQDLARAIKARLDPRGILNPGRFVV